MGVLLSVVIPTRSRATTLKATLNSAIQQDFDDYEVIVSDNNSEDKTKEIVEQCKSDKVHYVNTGKRLSMCDNWEFALSHVTGKYVIYIGDDDAIMPGALRMLAQDIDGIGCDAYTWYTSTYQWPIDERSAEFIFDAGISDKPPTKGDLREAAKNVIRRGGWKYYRLPSVYHGAVATDVLKNIAETSGRVFHSTQPDLFTALAIPAFVNEYVRLPYSVTLQGRSAKSNGGASVSKNGNEVTQKFIDEYGGYRIHHSLPMMPKMMGALIADSFLLAKDLFPNLYGDITFNYAAMWAFLRRLKLVDKKFVYENREKFRDFHKLSIFEFEYYCLLHDIAGFRRKLLDHFSVSKKPKDVPNNVFDFAKMISNR